MRYSCGTNYTALRLSGNQIYFHTLKFANFVPYKMFFRTRLIFPLIRKLSIPAYGYFPMPHSCSNLREEGVFVRASLLPILFL